MRPAKFPLMVKRLGRQSGTRHSSPFGSGIVARNIRLTGSAIHLLGVYEGLASGQSSASYMDEHPIPVSSDGTYRVTVPEGTDSEWVRVNIRLCDVMPSTGGEGGHHERAQYLVTLLISCFWCLAFLRNIKV